VHTGLQWENLREENNLEGPGDDGNIILKWIFERLDGGIGWINLAQDRDWWRALINTLIKLRFP
jgi:hypothetical protein